MLWLVEEFMFNKWDVKTRAGESEEAVGETVNGKGCVLRACFLVGIYALQN